MEKDLEEFFGVAGVETSDIAKSICCLCGRSISNPHHFFMKDDPDCVLGSDFGDLEGHHTITYDLDRPICCDCVRKQKGWSFADSKICGCGTLNGTPKDCFKDEEDWAKTRPSKKSLGFQL